jgi:hypothetical protein
VTFLPSITPDNWELPVYINIQIHTYTPPPSAVFISTVMTHQPIKLFYIFNSFFCNTYICHYFICYVIKLFTFYLTITTFYLLHSPCHLTNFLKHTFSKLALNPIFTGCNNPLKFLLSSVFIQFPYTYVTANATIFYNLLLSFHYSSITSSITMLNCIGDKTFFCHQPLKFGNFESGNLLSS